MCLWNTFNMRYRSIKLDNLEKWPFQWPRSTRVKVNPQKSFPIWSSDTSNWKYILRGIQICQNKLTLLPFSRSYMGLKVMNVKCAVFTQNSSCQGHDRSYWKCEGFGGCIRTAYCTVAKICMIVLSFQTQTYAKKFEKLGDTVKDQFLRNTALH